MKSLAAITLGTGLLASSAFGAISFNLNIDAIAESDGTTLISDEGLLVLVVDAGNTGFDLPEVGSLVSGDDEVVTYWDLSEEGINDPFISLTSDLVEWGAGWEEGRSLALYWFPTLDKDNMTPASDTAYGVFSDVDGLTSGDGWTLPANGEIAHRLSLFTAAATKFATVASLPAELGVAAYAVNNAPSTSAPSVPSVDVVADGRKNVLTWPVPASSVGGYIVQRKSSSGDWVTLGMTSGESTTFEDSAIRAGVSYEYRLYSVGAFGSALRELPVHVSARSTLVGVATRSRLVAGNPATAVFGGVIVEGNDPTKNVILQAIGQDFLGESVFIDDPAFDLYKSGVVAPIASADDWMSSSNALVIDDVMTGKGYIPTLGVDSRDAAEVVQVEKNQGYAFAVSSEETGDVFVGIFDADMEALSINDNRITSLAVRGYLDGTDTNSLFVGGLIVEGDVPKEVLVTAWGPYLSEKIDTSLAGLTIEDPKLNVRLGGSNDIIASNDNWEVQSASTEASVSIETDMDRIKLVMADAGISFDEGSPDALLLVTLEPGSYSFEITGSNLESGIGYIAMDEIELE